MVRKLSTFGLFAAAVGLSSTGLAAERSTWSKRAIADLRAIYSLIRDNHPGPVDSENPGFRSWMDKGFTAALKTAEAATNRVDYNRTLRTYVNGFRDSHLYFDVNYGPIDYAWAGFVTLTEANGSTIVISSFEKPVQVGDKAISCDGHSVPSLLDRDIYRLYTHPDIPHAKKIGSFTFFIPPFDDPTRHFRSCLFQSKQGLKTVRLKWRRISDAEMSEQMKLYPVSPMTELGVRNVNGVWFVSIPSFFAWGENAQRYSRFLEGLRRDLPALRAAPLVVVDVRRNTGGNSNLGEEAASILFGENVQKAISNSFDWTVDWRVSPVNVAVQRQKSKDLADAGDDEGSRERSQLADAMEAALQRGENLYRQSKPPSSKEPPPASPFKGRVFFLTDEGCASACLDFADIMRRIPGVTHIGMPTYADSVYMEIPNMPPRVPSRLARLNYPLKVYRNRTRRNNEWYEPQIRWPGGTMTTSAVAAWVKTLN